MDKVLVIVAHPDDEVLGCGGTILKLVERDYKVNLLVLGEGITSRYYGFFHPEKEKEVKDLQWVTQQVGLFLGIKEVVNFFKFPDQQLDTIPFLKVVQSVEVQIERVQPNVIYTHFIGDLNLDHQITCKAVLTATRPVKGCPVRKIYSFEVPSSTEWSFGQGCPTFTPNTFVDIDGHLDRKIEALKMYESEVREFPHPRSPGAIASIASRWGSVVGLRAAEAFQLVRSIE